MVSPRCRVGRGRSLRALGATVAFCFSALTCGAPERAPTPVGDLAGNARFVSHVTGGSISRTGQILLRLTGTFEGRETDPAKLTSAFSFTPPIQGSASWLNERTVAFTPAKPLVPGTRYTGVVHLRRILPTAEGAGSFRIGFTVEPTRVLGIRGTVEPLTEGDPRTVVLVGTVEFSDSVSLADLEAHVPLKVDDARARLSWTGGPRVFTFRSDPIARTDAVQRLNVVVPVGPFALDREATYTTEVRPQGEMGVMEVTTGGEDRDLRITVKFTEPLSETQDASGYVAIEPYVPFEVSVVGRTLHIMGRFDRATRYTMAIRKGIRSRWNTTLRENYVREVAFGDLPPRLEFSSAGVFLPSKGERKVGFRTLNVRRVGVTVMQVFESNLGFFLQEYDLASAKDRGELWGDLDRVGVTVAAETLEIGAVRNRWVQSTLDLSPLLEKKLTGLFLVELSVGREDVLFTCEPTDEWIPWDHPCSKGYYYQYGTVVKPVVISDIGMLAKREGDRTLVATTHLGDASPLPGVKVTLFSYQNQPLESHVTDGEGIARFDSTGGFYLLGEWNGQRTALEFSETALNFGSFDVGGEAGSAQKVRAFVYAERGVHRPGDPVYLAAIVRDETGTFPSGNPLTMKVRNPKNQLVAEVVNREGINGHYGFTFTTAPTDPTGNWYAEFYNGNQLIARHRVRIETIVPNRLKVTLELPSDSLGPADRAVPMRLRSSYLFGAPASGLSASVLAHLSSVERRFPRFTDFLFTTPSRRFEGDLVSLFEDELGADGTASFTWTLPPFGEPPSAVAAVVTARVFERGGRPATQTYPVLIDPYEAYVGMRAPASSFLKVNSDVEVALVVVDRKGRPLRGREVTLNVYHNPRYWWWQFDEDHGTLKFKTDMATNLMSTQTVTTEEQPILVRFRPEAEGQLLVEAVDVAGGHQSGFFAWASGWGEAGAPMAAGTHLQLESDKGTYRPGERARVTVRTPSRGMLFFTVEKGARVLSHQWVRLTGPTTSLDVPITPDMLPTVYATAIVVQPYEQTANDRPMRLFGVIPLRVEDPTTKLAVDLELPDELKPLQDFTVKVRVPKGFSPSVTVAVVDEGLLDLTSFATPDPWSFFYAKERLGVTTYDVFDHVIGMLVGDIERRFQVGGDEEAFRLRGQAPVRAKPFEPVAMFRGPVTVDRRGEASFTFTMPNYMGSVRVMAVAADGPRLGAKGLAVPVREPLVLLPSLPRVIGPGESFVLTATVFATTDEARDVSVSVRTEGPLSVEGPTERCLEFAGKGEQDAEFTLRASPSAGVARVRIEARGGGHVAWTETELPVRPVNPHLYDSREFTIFPGERAEFELPALGIEGTRRASLRIASMPGLRFGARLARLTRFPYGCVEQTVSAVFPQLYLKDFMTFLHKGASTRHEVRVSVDRNINAAVDRLRRFQTADGGFAYWQGGSAAADWATNYAGHFLLEAKAQGYFVPSDMLSRWLASQRRLAAAEAGDYLTRCYRLYLLAMAGEPALGPMNLMREERLQLLDPVSRWYLAAAYLLSGMEGAAHEILRIAGTEVRDYRESGGTYGSTLRDKAILLELATLTGKDELAMRLFDEVNTALASQDYLSSHEAGYALVAVGKYLKAFWRHDAQVKGTVQVAGERETQRFDVRGEAWETDLTPYTGRTVTVTSLGPDPIYAVFEWEGIPLEGPTAAEARNLSLSVRWLSEGGAPIDPTRLSQHTTFWCHIRVGLTQGGTVENVALTQIFPSGWEIENTRLTGEASPVWARSMALGSEDYMDVRDDRVMWFMRLDGRRAKDFLVRLVAVTKGSFTLAPTVAEAMYDPAYRAYVPGGSVTVR